MAYSRPVSAIQSDREFDTSEPKDFFSIFGKLGQLFPFGNRTDTKVEVVVGSDSNGEVEGEALKPNVVSFPGGGRPLFPRLEHETEESSGKTHNPIIIWQVYAIGGFIILKWACARWKERQSRINKKETDDDGQNPETAPASDKK